jgi:hypothetical protein
MFLFTHQRLSWLIFGHLLCWCEEVLIWGLLRELRWWYLLRRTEQRRSGFWSSSGAVQSSHRFSWLFFLIFSSYFFILFTQICLRLVLNVFCVSPFYYSFFFYFVLIFDTIRSISDCFPVYYKYGHLLQLLFLFRGSRFVNRPFRMAAIRCHSLPST